VANWRFLTSHARVMDPIKATVNVQNYLFAVSQQAQTSLRSIIGQSEMDQLLSGRDSVNRELRRIIDEPTEGPWGIRVERVEIQARGAIRPNSALLRMRLPLRCRNRRAPRSHQCAAPQLSQRARQPEGLGEFLRWQ